VAFTFEPKGEQTLVTWNMRGVNALTAQAIHLFMDTDAMVGGDFGKGLADMKVLAESRAAR
jgi:hypothetical protein